MMVDVWKLRCVGEPSESTSTDYVSVEGMMAGLLRILVREPMNIWVIWLSVTVILNLQGLGMPCDARLEWSAVQEADSKQGNTKDRMQDSFVPGKLAASFYGGTALLSSNKTVKK